MQNNKKAKNSSLLSKFLNDKKSRIRCKSGNSLHSNTPAFARLILFDFLSKISIRNSLIFYFKIELLILQQPLFIYNISLKFLTSVIFLLLFPYLLNWHNLKENMSFLYVFLLYCILLNYIILKNFPNIHLKITSH